MDSDAFNDGACRAVVDRMNVKGVTDPSGRGSVGHVGAEKSSSDKTLALAIWAN